MIRSICIIVALLIGGCSTPTTQSFDATANYCYVFKDMRSPMPKVVRSRVERDDRRLLGVKMNPTNGDWEFEIIASSNWVAEVKMGFLPTSFKTVPERGVPSWFSPNEDAFEVFQLQYSSFPTAHLYVERSPKNPEAIHVFIRRH